MLQEEIMVVGREEDIAAVLRLPSRTLPCERLLVCMTGAIQTANFSHFLIALRHVSCWKTRADRLERTSEPDDEVMVFVVGPSMSGMRERADVDPD